MNISHCPRCGYPLVKGSDGKWLCFCLADPKGFKKKQALLNKKNAQQSVYLTKSRWAQFWDKLSAAFRR